MARSWIGINALILIILIGFGIWIYHSAHLSPLVYTGTSATTTTAQTKTVAEKHEGAPIGEENTVVFKCTGDLTVTAVFVRDIAALTLSDGRHFELLQDVSASGAKYVDAYNGIVFWGKGRSAVFEENGGRVHQDCTPVSQ